MNIKFSIAIFVVGSIFSVSLFAQSAATFEQRRKNMVEEEIAGAGVKNKRVIESMLQTPRHEFVSLKDRQRAYFDMALPIGESQTISPPFVVAYMTEAIDPQPSDRVLEIGTGSGYQAAVLSPLVKEVYTIEIVEKLGKNAAKALKSLKYANVHVKIGDGFQGWPEKAPFDKIIVTCSPEKVPPALVAQLKEGGRMVVPVGERYQQIMYLLKKVRGKLETEALRPTLFVPMTGKAESQRKLQPDPANPKIQNGGFEEAVGDPPEPLAWHYGRQFMFVASDSAPEGKQYIKFTNADAGRNCQILQAFAVDGRKVQYLDVAFSVAGKDIHFAPIPNSKPERYCQPGAVFIFYDENRAPLGETVLGPWRGTFPWQKESRRVEVPLRAREAFLSIGLLGATGEIRFDDLNMTAGKK
ncbi:MAG: protein-L-isoaspartate(D-aspartate) O-methyltransferase [Pirellulales bacterium]|nr:protein-L-isoaspartate(D-aspartate) O-methyltransferase [Pirellulales bacterium]